MPSPLFADRPAPQPPERGALDALISQTRRLRGGLDAVRRGSGVEDEQFEDPRARWQRALCELAVHHLDDLGEHLGQLREGVPTDLEETPPRERRPAAPPEPEHRSLLSRVGSAEWNLLTDEVTWSPELYEIFGRQPADGGLSLDELPSWVHPADQAALTAMVTDCLVDGTPIDGEFRIMGPGPRERTVHMMGEPVLEADGSTGSMWAVLRDVSALRRSQQAVRESRDSLQRERHIAQAEHRLAVELQEAVLPPWRGSLRLPHPTGEDSLDLAAHYFPSAISALIGGDWYDALHLPDGRTLLSVGDLTGHGVAATSGMATLLGALRGMAVAGVEPGPLMGFLNHMLDAAPQPALGSAICALYDPRAHTLTWSQAGHPAPLLFRGGAGWSLRPPEGVLLGATSGATYTQRTEVLEPGDMLVLHTDGLAPRGPLVGDATGAERLLRLADRFASARTAQECVRSVAETFGNEEREDDACVLIARIGSDA
ncbi:SpoIIE family protein phosphatase [Streptomyces sp. AC563]|uniref:PP2C family protein-serine/threonine phosphatase n=1 Tax=Streptomyces buecherae TaxID=2763006 RepID=UPI00164D9D91|nr:SpoIIE family protein phosphatase [Streptomyces buecherae]MBC3988796.1 SpoIIE family protein phosphatase [Streptomyces buecherae]